jgi:hypothetical protein
MTPVPPAQPDAVLMKTTEKSAEGSAAAWTVASTVRAPGGP